MRRGKDGQFQRDPYKYFEHRLSSLPAVSLRWSSSADLGAGTRRLRERRRDRLPDPRAIARVALVRAGAVTHNFYMDQRYVGLEFLGTTTPT